MQTRSIVSCLYVHFVFFWLLLSVARAHTLASYMVFWWRVLKTTGMLCANELCDAKRWCTCHAIRFIFAFALIIIIIIIVCAPHNTTRHKHPAHQPRQMMEKKSRRTYRRFESQSQTHAGPRVPTTTVCQMSRFVRDKSELIYLFRLVYVRTFNFRFEHLTTHYARVCLCLCTSVYV